jgi:hypothetical protein
MLNKEESQTVGKSIFALTLLLFIITGCTNTKPTKIITSNYTLDTISLFDNVRQRTIPIAIYGPSKKK